MDEARRLCSSGLPRLGSYAVASSDTETRGYRRLIGCSAPTAAFATPTDWAPAPEDEAAAHQAFLAYFQTFDSGNASSETIGCGALDRAADTEAMAQFTQMMGTGQRTVYGLMWRLNPTDQPHPGVYVDILYYGGFSAGRRSADRRYYSARMRPRTCTAGT